MTTESTFRYFRDHAGTKWKVNAHESWAMNSTATDWYEATCSLADLVRLASSGDGRFVETTATGTAIAEAGDAASGGGAREPGEHYSNTPQSAEEVLSYLAYQFPATIGHRPLREMLERLIPHPEPGAGGAGDEFKPCSKCVSPHFCGLGAGCYFVARDGKHPDKPTPAPGLTPRTAAAKRAYDEYKRKCHDDGMAGGKTVFAHVPDGWDTAETIERELAEARADIKGYIEREARMVKASQRAAEDAEQSAAGMRKALEPFAMEADNWQDSVPDDHRSLCTEPVSDCALEGSETAFTVGDLRRAKALLAGASGDGKEGGQ